MSSIEDVIAVLSESTEGSILYEAKLGELSLLTGIDVEILRKLLKGCLKSSATNVAKCLKNAIATHKESLKPNKEESTPSRRGFKRKM